MLVLPSSILLQDIVKVHDKLHSRLPGQRLTTRYFVEFNDGRTEWVDSEFVPDIRYKNFRLSFDFAEWNKNCIILETFVSEYH